MIAIKSFCTSHGIETDFVYSIQETGLIEIVKRDEDEFVEEAGLEALEKSVRLHKDLHINTEGIAAVFDLLDQMDSMREEMTRLRNRLELYE